MARSPESAKAKQEANEAMNHPHHEAARARLLKGPDGFVYVWTEALSKQSDFELFTGEVNAAGFAVAPAATE